MFTGIRARLSRIRARWRIGHQSYKNICSDRHIATQPAISRPPWRNYPTASPATASANCRRLMQTRRNPSPMANAARPSRI